MKIVSRINKSIKILSLTAALGVGFVLPAFALDGDAFFARVQADMKKAGYNIEAGKISVDGTNVTASDVKIIEADAPGKKDVVLKEIVFENVEEDKDGGYLVGRAAVDEFKDETEKDSGKTGTIQGFEVTKLLLKSEKNEAAYKGQIPYEKISFKKINVEEKGKTVVALDNLSIGFAEFVPNKSVNFAGELGNLKIDVASLPNDDPKAVFTEMGYNEIGIQGKFNFAVNLVDGLIDVTFNGNMNDAGQLNIAVTLSGLTKDMADELILLSDQANTASEKEKNAIGVRVLGLIQQLNLNSVDVKFDDNSITNKIIELKKGSTVKREDFVSLMKVMVTQGLASLEHPDFAQKASTEIGKYLDTPQNIEIIAKPDHATPFAVIAAAAMSSRKDLIDLLKIDVKANQ